MDLSPLPQLSAIERISPSFYSTSVKCMAGAAWYQFGPQDSPPVATGAILGSAFHAVMEMANRGAIPAGNAGLAAAKEAFDRQAHFLFDRAHPLVRIKFGLVQNVPYYHQRRSRAAAMAAQASNVARRTSETHAARMAVTRSTDKTLRRLIEARLTSADGEISGRVDLLDCDEGRVTDYKSGHAPRAGADVKGEIRQMRLYVHLALENGYFVNKASIIRGDGTTVEIEVPEVQAREEGNRARAVRQEFNAAVAGGRALLDLAAPAPSTCAGCPYVAFCEAFWAKASPEWEAVCGAHAEGRVLGIDESALAGADLATFRIDCRRGSTLLQQLIVEQVPREWLSIGSRLPAVGDLVRFVQAFRAQPSGNEQRPILRVDRFKSTTIWIVTPVAVS